MHLLVSAPGFETLTTHLFVAGSPYLEQDAVFAVKSDLIVDFVEVDQAAEGLDRPYRHADVEVVLVPASSAAVDVG